VLLTIVPAQLTAPPLPELSSPNWLSALLCEKELLLIVPAPRIAPPPKSAALSLPVKLQLIIVIWSPDMAPPPSKRALLFEKLLLLIVMLAVL